jgi:polar amino acid transport system ATP-binding protein
MASPIIKIDAISKSFGALKVLDHLSMQVMPGEKLALIGHPAHPDDAGTH